MRLPRLEHALIDPEKLRDYLLSPKHDRGRFKAAVFATMGYSPEDWRRFESDIRKLIATCEATTVQPTAHGQKYVVTGTLEGPAKRPKRIRTLGSFGTANTCHASSPPTRSPCDEIQEAPDRRARQGPA